MTNGTLEYRLRHDAGSASILVVTFDEPLGNLTLTASGIYESGGPQAFWALPWVVPVSQSSLHFANFGFGTESEVEPIEYTIAASFADGIEATILIVAGETSGELNLTIHGFPKTGFKLHECTGPIEFHDTNGEFSESVSSLEYPVDPGTAEIVQWRTPAATLDAASIRASLSSGATWEGPAWNLPGSRNGEISYAIGGYSESGGTSTIEAKSGAGSVRLHGVAIQVPCLAFLPAGMEW